jgi:hypothetical protein
MKVHLHPDALAELHRATEWYAGRSAHEAARRLLHAVDARVAEIAKAP